MAPLHPQHLVPIPQQPTSWECLALLLLPTIFHLSRKKSYSGSSNVSTLYIDFSVLLSDNLYPHPSLPAQNQYKLEVNPQDPSALAIVPSQQRKRRVDGLHSWLEAWNIYLRTVLHHFPLLAPDLIAYQDQICKFSRKFRASAWIMYYTWPKFGHSNLRRSFCTVLQLYDLNSICATFTDLIVVPCSRRIISIYTECVIYFSNINSCSFKYVFCGFTFTHYIIMLFNSFSRTTIFY